MYLVIVAWDLTDSAVSLGELRAWVATKAAADYTTHPGVRIKSWFSNERKRTWGAVYIVDKLETLHHDRLPKLPNGQSGPIGAPPTMISCFDLEAFVQGPEDFSEVLTAGRVWEQASA